MSAPQGPVLYIVGYYALLLLLLVLLLLLSSSSSSSSSFGHITNHGVRRFLSPVTHVLPEHASLSYWAIWRCSSVLRLSIYVSAFQWAFFLRNFFFSSIRSGIHFVEYPYSLPSSLSSLNIHVHSDQQKSSVQKFSKYRTGSHVTYSCFHNSSRFTFPIFVHSWRFCLFHSLQSITPRIF